MNHHDTHLLRRAEAARARVPQLAPEMLDEQMALGLLAIDVREHAEHAKSTVPGAINIASGSLEQQITSRVADKAAALVCFCNGGNRGALAAAKLLDLGYTNVKLLAGGLRAYVALSKLQE